MKIGILGTGSVGGSLGKGFLALGHEVRLGSREANNERGSAWAKQMGPRASAGSFGEVAAWGELLVLATLGVANAQAIRLAGPTNFAGKIVIDATNPLDFSAGFPPTLAVIGNDSGGEQVQRALPLAHVVKAFNTAGNADFFHPDFPGGPPDMFMCGNHEPAKQQVAGILKDFGWGVVDIGGIEGARYLEAMCIVWVLHGGRTNSWNHAFKLLHR